MKRPDCWSFAEEYITWLEARLAEIEGSNKLYPVTIAEVFARAEKAEARLAEAERVIAAARGNLGILAPIHFNREDAENAAAAAWVHLDNYHYAHLRAESSAERRESP